MNSNLAWRYISGIVCLALTAWLALGGSNGWAVTMTFIALMCFGGVFE